MRYLQCFLYSALSDILVGDSSASSTMVPGQLLPSLMWASGRSSHLMPHCCPIPLSIASIAIHRTASSVLLNVDATAFRGHFLPTFLTISSVVRTDLAFEWLASYLVSFRSDLYSTAGMREVSELDHVLTASMPFAPRMKVTIAVIYE